MKKKTTAAAVVLAIGCSAACSSSSSGGAGSGSDAGGDSSAGSRLAPGIAIDGITICQGTSVPIVAARAEVTKRNAPIVVGRDALVRVFVKPDATFAARGVVARVTITAGGAPTELVASLTPAGASDDGKLDTTLNVEVPGAAITADAEISVRIEEKPGATPPSGSTDGAVWPATGTTKLAATSSNGNLAVVLVPFRYTADMSNRVPDISAAVVKQIFDGVAAQYPVPAIDVTVHAPVDLATTLAPTGTGWDEWLMQLQTLRTNEALKSNVVYLGVAMPADSNSAYCGGACVQSVSSGNPTTGAAPLAAVIALFTGNSGDGGASDGGAPTLDNYGGVFANAIGPLFGRLRAPCGNPPAPDPMFPYSDGQIGVRGYDRRTKTLLDPTATKDFMSFCAPTWTSDYTFAGIFSRLSFLNKTAR